MDLDIDKEKEVLPEIRLALGSWHACSIDGEGVLKCWGWNQHQQSGVSSSGNPICDPNIYIKDSCIRTPTRVDLGANRSARRVSGGSNHGCAILDDGSVKCWGRNDRGQLGYGSLSDPDSLPTGVDLGDKTAVAIELGVDHSCAILADGSVKCWGENNKNQVAPSGGETRNRPVDVTLPEGRRAREIGLGLHHTCALLDDDSLVCWGGNGLGRLGVGDTTDRPNPTEVTFSGNKTAVAIGMGYGHTCAILNDGSLVCWGANRVGQLGVGGTSARNTPTQVNLGADRTAVDLSLGDYHTCAILDDGSVKCWGGQ